MKQQKLVLNNVDSFELPHIFDCGQCFRWDIQSDGSYIGVIKSGVMRVSKVGNSIIFEGILDGDINSIVYDYFDLGNDYEEIINKLKVMDEYLDKATEFGEGIRILKQDGWEMLISFIISSNNRIPMIQRAINNLSKNFGTHIGEYRGQDYYAFPTPEQLNKASQEEIRACSTGFRDKYIKSTTQTVNDENINVLDYRNLSTEECLKQLREFNGVGPKVGDCIALFGMQKYDTFPVDVWVKRVMQEFYVDEDLSLTKIRKFGIEKFGELSGFAQQYLFYYARELGIGR